MINTIWKHSQTEDNGIKTYTLNFLPNGIFKLDDYRPSIDMTVDRTGTWVCTEGSLKISGKRLFPWQQEAYVLQLDNNTLYIADPNNPDKRLYQFIRE